MFCLCFLYGINVVFVMVVVCLFSFVMFMSCIISSFGYVVFVIPEM